MLAIERILQLVQNQLPSHLFVIRNSDQCDSLVFTALVLFGVAALSLGEVLPTAMKVFVVFKVLLSVVFKSNLESW